MALKKWCAGTKSVFTPSKPVETSLGEARSMGHSITQELTSETSSLYTNGPRPALRREFALGDWVVHPDLNRLHSRQGGIERQLEPRLIHLLCYLAANPDRVLTRDELVNELWPRVIVNENSLTRAISELRKQLAIPGKPGHHYIETIPKKGYRLIPAIEASSRPAVVKPLVTVTAAPAYVLPAFQPRLRVAAAVLSLCLALGLWLGLQGTLTAPMTMPGQVLLADEVVDAGSDFMGGEVTLSTAPDLSQGTRTIEARVLSSDESQYAYIQHDHTGSTIFLGKLDALAAPVIAIYNCPEKIYNLAWSPLGRGLIFARSSQMTTAALFSDDRSNGELMMLDLTTLEVHRLLLDNNASEADKNKPQSLT